MMHPSSISLAITHFNRYAFLLECIAQVKDDPRIAEIVISDDASTDGSYEKLVESFRDLPKVRLFRNEKNLDCYFNKQKAVERAMGEWVILFDSDNILSKAYLDALFALEGWDPQTVYCPEFAEPSFDYRSWSGQIISSKNVAALMTPPAPSAPPVPNRARGGRTPLRPNKTNFGCLLNTCNYFVHRASYLEVWDGSVNPHTADSIYQIYNWLRSGRQLMVVSGLRYFHRLHDGSHYKLNHHLTKGFDRVVEDKLRQVKGRSMVIPRTYGRMGNFLFQAAAAMGYAWKHGLEFTLPNRTTNPKGNPIYLQHLVNTDWSPSLPEIKLTEGVFYYQELPFREIWRRQNIVLDGYWQTEKYFKEFRDRIIAAFGFPWRPLPGFVSVHVRRGDYLMLTQKHPLVSKEWIDAAMRVFPGYHFIFFSDDIPWCRATYGMRKDVTISKGTDEVADLTYMATCEHHICSASTYSWWGAWLNQNPNKRIIMPKQWFMPGRPEDTRDIVPLEWERL